MSPSGKRGSLALAVGVAAVAGACLPAFGAEPLSAAMRRLRYTYNDASMNMVTFHTMDSIFDTIPVKKGRSVWRLGRAEKPLTFTYDFEGKSYTPADFLDRTYTNALLIIKDDKIVYEKYRNYTDDQTHFLSMSMAKSFTSTLIGAALEDGYIKSLDDQIVTYVPALRGSAYEGVTIRNGLRMQTGVDRDDVYRVPEAGTDEARRRDANMDPYGKPVADEALAVKRADEPGKTFRYYTGNTTVLGRVLEGAVKAPLADYMSRRIWSPLGAESDGFWIAATSAENGGRPINGMGYNAVLRDYGRFGLMMLHNGVANGRRIVSAAWVREATVPAGPEPADSRQTRGYQYQWWTLTNTNAYMAVGLQGQFIFVDPDTRTVIVKLSYMPLGDSKPGQESEAFFRAASTWRP